MIAARHRHRLTFLVALTRLRHLVSTCTGRYKEQLPFLSSMRKGGTARSKPLDSSSRRSRTSLFNRCFRQVTVIAKETLFLKALLVFEHECLHSTTRSPVHPRQFCSHTKTLNSCLCQGCYFIFFPFSFPTYTVVPKEIHPALRNAFETGTSQRSICIKPPSCRPCLP